VETLVAAAKEIGLAKAIDILTHERKVVLEALHRFTAPDFVVYRPGASTDPLVCFYGTWPATWAAANALPMPEIDIPFGRTKARPS
jgi:hypothetical protein